MRIGALSAVYCERSGDPGFWAEPVNAVTNLAFLVAGIAAVNSFCRGGLTPWRHADIATLIALGFAIGIGSALWHTLATRGAELFDVVPIMVFILLCLPVVLVRVLRLRTTVAACIFVFFVAVNVAAVMLLPPSLWNGSAFYLPTWAASGLVALELKRRRDPLAARVLCAVPLFAASLCFRSIDLIVCDSFAIGTHFLWHLLNAAVLWLLLTTIITATANRRSERAASRAQRR